jgi:hypothetical protein
VPYERLGVAVAVVDEVADGLFQLFGGAMDCSPYLLFGESGEPSLDQVEP